MPDIGIHFFLIFCTKKIFNSKTKINYTIAVQLAPYQKRVLKATFLVINLANIEFLFTGKLTYEGKGYLYNKPIQFLITNEIRLSIKLQGKKV